MTFSPSPMGTKITPYVSSDDEAKKNQVERMFDGIAHRYDFLNHFFSLGIDVLWRKACIRILRKESPTKLLDVATGTADFAIEAVRMGLDVHVSGVDISAGMLDVGRKKVAARGWDDRIDASFSYCFTSCSNPVSSIFGTVGCTPPSSWVAIAPSLEVPKNPKRRKAEAFFKI